MQAPLSYIPSFFTTTVNVDTVRQENLTQNVLSWPYKADKMLQVGEPSLKFDTLLSV